MKKRALGLGVLGATVVGVFASRRAAKPSPNVPQIAPAGDLISVGGETIHLIDRGSGPALVLLHGFAANTFSWRKNFDELSRTHRVLALDFPGFGFSDRGATLNYGHDAHAARVIGLLDHLGIERAFVAGHSMGGGIAQRIATRYPERLLGLVLVASVDASTRMQRGRPGGRGVKMAMKHFQRSRRLMSWAGHRGLMRCVHDPSIVDSEMVAGYIDPLLLPGTVEALFRMAARTYSEPLVTLAEISAPTLIIAGRTDRIVPLATAEALRRGISGSQLSVVEAAGHLVPEEQPEQFTSAITSFLAAHAPA